MTTPYVLILFYSRHGATARMANLIARGVEKHAQIEARVRTVPPVAPISTDPQTILANDVPDNGAPYASLDDLRDCSALALGSPARFGNIAAALKCFLENSSTLWLNGDLVDKPAGVFTSASSMHGGHETTLHSMMLPLLHHGMLITGIPATEKMLGQTRSGGTPYGPSHLSEPGTKLTDEESAICKTLGLRLARLACKLL